MKYENEVNELLNIIAPKEDWMNDEDYQELIDLSLKHMGTSIQGLSDAIEEGVKNGFPAKFQVTLFKVAHKQE